MAAGSLLYILNNKSEDCPADLNGCLLGFDLVGLLKVDQSPELRVIIKDPEVPILELDDAVDPGNADVVDPHLATVPSAQLYLSLLSRLDNDYGRHHIHVLLNFLQNQVGSLGLLQLY